MTPDSPFKGASLQLARLPPPCMGLSPPVQHSPSCSVTLRVPLTTTPGLPLSQRDEPTGGLGLCCPLRALPSTYIPLINRKPRGTPPQLQCQYLRFSSWSPITLRKATEIMSRLTTKQASHSFPMVGPHRSPTTPW